MSYFDEYVRSKAAFEQFLLEELDLKTFELQEPYIVQTKARVVEEISKQGDHETVETLYRLLTVVTDNYLSELRAKKANQKN